MIETIINHLFVTTYIPVDLFDKESEYDDGRKFLKEWDWVSWRDYFSKRICHCSKNNRHEVSTLVGKFRNHNE